MSILNSDDHTALLDAPGFKALLAELLDTEPGWEDLPNPRLVEDLGLDSLQMFYLLLVIETIANVLEPPIAIPVLETMDDAFAYYLSLYQDTA